jgi:hypothetical protein
MIRFLTHPVADDEEAAAVAYLIEGFGAEAPREAVRQSQLARALKHERRVKFWLRVARQAEKMRPQREPLRMEPLRAEPTA